MLTVLSVKKEQNTKWYYKFLRWFFRNKINFNVKTLGKMKYLHITVLQRQEKILWKKVSKKLNGNTTNILCRKEINLPQKYGFSRFESRVLQEQFCKNSAIDILKKSNIDPQKLKIALFDPEAINSDILEYLVLFSSNVIVVTQNRYGFVDIQEKLMQEYGASIVVTDKLEWLFQSHIIIAPGKIKSVLPIKSSAVVMTSDKSVVMLKGVCYSDYKVDIPKCLKEFIPRDLEKEYFLSALYEQYNIKSLSNLVPTVCLSDNKVVKNEDISNYLSMLVCDDF